VESGLSFQLPSFTNLTTAVMFYLKWRLRKVRYCLGFTGILLILFLNTLYPGTFAVYSVPLAWAMFPCIILLDIYLTAAQQTTVAMRMWLTSM
jgi:hypothetical protein